MFGPSVVSGKVSSAGLELSKITLDMEYRKKWNVDYDDSFVCLTKDGVPVNKSVYRVGGHECYLNRDYFLLIKYVEAIYPDAITKDKSKKRHLEGHTCIIDKHGVERIEFKSFQTPYLHGGVIYSLDNNYYNIETGEFYGRGYNSIRSDDFIFLDNMYDEDKSRRGVIKINKKDGSYEIFK